MKIKEIKPLPEIEAMSYVEKELKEDLSYNEELALKHKKILGITKTKATKLLKSLSEIISLNSAVKIIDTFPANEEVIKFILSLEGEEDKFDEVMKIIKEVESE